MQVQCNKLCNMFNEFTIFQINVDKQWSSIIFSRFPHNVYGVPRNCIHAYGESHTPFSCNDREAWSLCIINTTWSFTLWSLPRGTNQSHTATRDDFSYRITWTSSLMECLIIASEMEGGVLVILRLSMMVNMFVIDVNVNWACCHVNYMYFIQTRNLIE